MHADLSEYNILYHEGHMWIIDVSQSVEHDHPSAFDFLRNDIKNVEEFFGRLGVKCLGLRRCFEFVTKEKVIGREDETEGDVLLKWLEEAARNEAEPVGEIDQPENGLVAVASHLPISNSDPNSTHKTEMSQETDEDAVHEDSVFLHSFIPRTLNEVFDPERDVERLSRGDNLIYSDTIGLAPRSAKAGGGAASDDNFGTDPDDVRGDKELESETEEQGDGNEEGQAFSDKTPRGHRHEDKDAKRVGIFLELNILC